MRLESLSNHEGKRFIQRFLKAGTTMKNMIYNDQAFSIASTGSGWDITRKLPNGDIAVVGANLFAGLSDSDAQAQAQALIRTIFPVGVKIVGPDVTHPDRVGDLKIVGPDVGHPNFIYWDRDSTSFAR
jgi:hypothetical protein